MKKKVIGDGKEGKELPKSSDEQVPDDLPPESYLVAWVFIFAMIFTIAIILITIF
ncbi:MAG TPA: hypothetical protein PLW49_00175 [bacterium]|jgi:hypothetical protein|nr:hypothetical protein [bacterium]